MEGVSAESMSLSVVSPPTLGGILRPGGRSRYCSSICHFGQWGAKGRGAGVDSSGLRPPLPAPFPVPLPAPKCAGPLLKKRPGLPSSPRQSARGCSDVALLRTSLL